MPANNNMQAEIFYLCSAAEAVKPGDNHEARACPGFLNYFE